MGALDHPQATTPSEESQRPRRATRSCINYRPINYYATRLGPEIGIPIQQNPPKDNSLDPWFECHGFAPRPHGATKKEIKEDLHQMGHVQGAGKVKAGGDLRHVEGVWKAIKLKSEDELRQMKVGDSPVLATEKQAKDTKSAKPGRSTKHDKGAVSVGLRASERIKASAKGSSSTMVELPVEAGSDVDLLMSISMEAVRSIESRACLPIQSSNS